MMRARLGVRFSRGCPPATGVFQLEHVIVCRLAPDPTRSDTDPPFSIELNCERVSYCEIPEKLLLADPTLCSQGGGRVEPHL